MEYKGLKLDDRLVQLIRYMTQVDDLRETIGRYQATWDNLALLGQLSGVGNEMGSTRESFFELSESLVNHLGHEHWKELNQRLSMKASVATDMMQRNLFERTADIGFLATDQTIINFLSQPESFSQDVLRQHLESYVANYSVYHDVILLDTSGRLLFQLNSSDVKFSQDKLIETALNTNEPYVEVFRSSDLLPSLNHAHIYAYRIENKLGNPLGVLCLCFDFQDECQRIFTELNDGDWSIICLTDNAGKVIGSSDLQQLPIGTEVSHSLKDMTTQRLAGRKYLVSSRIGKGYQGYTGQSWLGHVMIPLEFAFERNEQPSIDLASLQSLDIFSNELMNIPAQADRIQVNLNRSVWNGSLHQQMGQTETLFSRALLWEISQTGLKTKSLLADAIDNLYQTVIGATLADNRFLASLAVNIKDRNLYERANDCRWWALTARFREALAQPCLTIDTQEDLTSILAYINQLYTVYTGIVLYDRAGKVVAVSQPHLNHWVDQTITESWVSKSLSLRTSSEYVISDFIATPLYDEQPTYIYAAAVMHPNSYQQVIGGIAVIFDSQPQLTAMLADAQPNNDTSNSFSVFFDDQNRIVATTHPAFLPTSTLPIDLAQAIESGYGIVNCQDGRYAVGVAKSAGYREYPSSNNAKTTYAAVFSRIGELITSHEYYQSKDLTSHQVAKQSLTKDNSISIATFTIGRQYYALPVDAIIEAVDLTHMRQGIPSDDISFVGYVSHQQRVIPVISPIRWIGHDVKREQAQLLVIQHDFIRFALMVDQLGQIQHLSHEQVMPSPSNIGNGLVAGLISMGENEDEVILLLSIDAMIQNLKPNKTTH
jgi:chemotaxis signal transduction protein